MLKNIDPLLNAQLLGVLRAMGHGDEICLVDANFPAASVAGLKPLILLDGVSVTRAAAAILSVLPLDTFVDHPVRRMEVVGQPKHLPPVQQEVQAVVDAEHGSAAPMAALERFAFYAAARQAYAVVATGESRGYGCFLLKKGVIMSPE